jgi:ribosomal protein S18 acetylase RimI-like enzyme
LLRRLQNQAAEAGCLLGLHVAADNPGAQRLYTRLGLRFVSEADAGQFYRAMQWQPAALAVACSID